MGDVLQREGFLSLEEHMQEYTELFLELQKGKVAEILAEQCAALEERERKTKIFLSSVYLRECFALTRIEYWTVMYAFCCELEEGLCLDHRAKCGESLPNLQYILHLLSPVLPVDFSYVAQFYGGQGALNDILDIMEEDRSVLQRPLRLNPAITCFLLTGRLPRAEWYEFLEMGEELLPLHEREHERLCRYLETGEPVRILLRADRGCGGHSLLRRIGKRQGQGVMSVHVSRLFGLIKQSPSSVRQTLRVIVGLSDPLVILEDWDAISKSGEGETELKKLLADLENSTLCFFLARTRAQAGLLAEYTDVSLSLKEELTEEEMRMVLDAWLTPEQRRPWQEELLAAHRLNIGELRRRCRAIALRAKADDLSMGEREVWLSGIQSEPGTFRLGSLIEDVGDQEEIILPADCQRQLDTVMRLAKAWRGGKGLQLMFHGSSGTGKTMAASVLARQLRLPLFKVDLSQVFDKYIGETEKHVDEIFRMAQRNRCLLFFDEADALFAKRTAVRDSHDRYANVSAAYLLQRMEEYEGILILATNLKDHFDDAFVRRIRFIVKFRNPDRDVRERLWRMALKGEPPVARDVDFEALAEAAQLSPARICAAAHVAQLLASCDKSSAVTREHLLEALELEAGKDETAIGRI